jgi:SAM-dependent methyltransferase
MKKLLKKIALFFVGRSKKWSRKNLYEFIDSQLKAITPGMSVLNVGASGEVGSRLSRALTQNNTGIELVSTDIDPERNPDIVCDVCDMPFPDNSFNAVFLIEVLEHVHNPPKALSEIYRVLKPDGTLIFSVPFIFPLHDRPGDYFRYTKYGLKLLLRDYDQVCIFERNSFCEAITVLKLRLIIERSYKLRILGILFLLSGATLLVPLCNLLIRSDSLTTGYAGNATKPVKKDG